VARKGAVEGNRVVEGLVLAVVGLFDGVVDLAHDAQVSEGAELDIELVGTVLLDGAEKPDEPLLHQVLELQEAGIMVPHDVLDHGDVLLHESFLGGPIPFPDARKQRQVLQLVVTAAHRVPSLSSHPPFKIYGLSRENMTRRAGPAAGFSARSARTDDEPDRGALLAVDLDFAERGHAHQVDAVGRDKAAGNGDGLDRLVHCARPNGLNFHYPFLPQYRGQGAGNGLGLRRGRNLEYLHGRRLLLRWV